MLSLLLPRPKYVPSPCEAERLTEEERARMEFCPAFFLFFPLATAIHEQKLDDVSTGLYGASSLR